MTRSAPPINSYSWLLLLCIVSATALLSTTATTDSDNDSVSTTTTRRARHDFSVGGYLPDYRSGIDLNATAGRHLTDLLLFSMEIPSSLSSSDDDEERLMHDLDDWCCLHAHHLEEARQAQIYAIEASSSSPLRLWATVGGGGRTAQFYSFLADTATKKRQAFIRAVGRWSQKEGLYGIDLDLYQPQTMAQHNDYLQFLMEAAPIWKSLGLHLSIGLHPNQKLPVQAYQVVDRIHLMAYDMMSPPQQQQQEGASSYHASFRGLQKAVTILVSSGCPKEKIMIGIPFYSRHRDQPGIVKTFYELYDEQKRLPKATPFAWETSKLMARKIQYVKDEGLGGMFVWELGQDKYTPDRPGGTLLEQLSQEIVRQLKDASSDNGATDGHDPKAAEL